MRTVTLILILAVATPAHADSFAELVGGVGIPLGDNTWTNDVSSSPKLVGRAGVINGQIGGALSVDWTHANMNTSFGQFGDLSGNRFRILANVVFQHALAPKLILSARAGAGIDIAHYSYSLTLLGVTSSGSDTDTGIGFELGGGVWFKVTDSTELGAEAGLPIGYHSKKAENNMPAIDYTSYDFDILFGVRVR